MNQNELREMLKQLHTELAEADQIDARSLELLNKVTQDVDRIIAGEAAELAASHDEDLSYSDQVKGLVSSFEVRHPVVSSLLERLSDGLANLGI